MRASLLGLLLLAPLACAGAGDPDRPDREDCARLRDHVIELRLAAADTSAKVAASDVAQHRAALQAAAGGSYVDDCRESRSPAEVSCLLAAADLDSVDACTASRASEGQP